VWQLFNHARIILITQITAEATSPTEMATPPQIAISAESAAPRVARSVATVLNSILFLTNQEDALGAALLIRHPLANQRLDAPISEHG